MIVLNHGKMQLALTPKIGGSIARLALGGREILRAAPAGLADPLDAACFPLVPYANRIASGTFRFAGRDIALTPNFGAHTLHGDGWRGPWQVVECRDARAVLRFDHEPGEWPWSYTAEQTFALLEDGLRIQLGIRNTDTQAMPISLGFHPYFPRTLMTTLDTSVGGVWLTDETLIPKKRIAQPLFANAADRRISQIARTDNCHDRWSGGAVVNMPEANLSLTLSASDELRFLHLYIPPGENFFCAEPVSAMPDAVNRPEAPELTGYRTLRPGETFAVKMKLRATISDS